MNKKKETKPEEPLNVAAESPQDADPSGAPETPETSAPSEASQPSEPSQPSEAPGLSETVENAEPSGTAAAGDVDLLVAEAEQRGYLRGRNEAIDELMREPDLFESPVSVTDPASDADESDPSQVPILQNCRVSIWDL